MYTSLCTENLGITMRENTFVLPRPGTVWEWLTIWFSLHVYVEHMTSSSHLTQMWDVTDTLLFCLSSKEMNVSEAAQLAFLSTTSHCRQSGWHPKEAHLQCQSALTTKQHGIMVPLPFATQEALQRGGYKYVRHGWRNQNRCEGFHNYKDLIEINVS